MLDVHPAHHAANTWRDFFIHIATIVLGLLIAVGLEQAVEALHHRHLAEVTRENLRLEIRHNQAEVAQNQVYIQQNFNRMEANLLLVRKLSSDAKALDHQTMHFDFSWSSFNQSAWRSARDSGALTLLPIEEVQRYDEAYTQQDLINQQAVAIFTEQTVASATLFDVDNLSDLTDEQRSALLHDIAVLTVKLNLLRQLTQQLDPVYKTALRE